MPKKTLSASRPPTPHPRTPIPLIIGCVTVRADESIRHRPVHSILLSAGDDGRQTFQVKRMHDPCSWRVNPEIGQRVRCPFHEPVAFRVALVFAFHVALERAGFTKDVDGNGVICRDVDGYDRVQGRGIATSFSDRRPHSSDIHQCGTAGRIVHQHPTGQEGNFLFAGPGLKPLQVLPSFAAAASSPAVRRTFSKRIR